MVIIIIPIISSAHRERYVLYIKNSRWCINFDLGIINKISYRDLVIITAYFYLTVSGTPNKLTNRAYKW